VNEGGGGRGNSRITLRGITLRRERLAPPGQARTRVCEVPRKLEGRKEELKKKVEMKPKKDRGKPRGQNGLSSLKQVTWYAIDWSEREKRGARGSNLLQDRTNKNGVCSNQCEPI